MRRRRRRRRRRKMSTNLFEDSFVEELLEFLVAVIYAELLEAVRLEVL